MEGDIVPDDGLSFQNAVVRQIVDGDLDAELAAKTLVTWVDEILVDVAWVFALPD
jgi:hypothetical protein